VAQKAGGGFVSVKPLTEGEVERAMENWRLKLCQALGIPPEYVKPVGENVASAMASMEWFGGPLEEVVRKGAEKP